MNSIKKYPDKRGLKVYSLGYFHKWCDENPNVSPLELFLWFKCSDMVFTDTFHGSVISLATRSQFISLIRNNQNKLAFLLQQYGVDDRVTSDFTDIEGIVDMPIDYNVVGKTILRIREESKEALIEAIKKCGADK